MPKRKQPLWLIWKHNDNHISKQIHREFEEYAKTTGFYPTQRGLFNLMTQGRWLPNRKFEEPRYKDLQLGSFDHWFDRLVDEGYIKVDDATRSVNSTGLVIVEKDNRPPELE